MHAFILKCVRRKKCEECVLIYPVWAKPTEPPSCVWCKYVAAEQLIETNHCISTSNFSQLVNLLPFLLLYLSLNLSSNLTVWVRNLDLFFLLEQNLFPLNALPAAAKSPKRRLWNRPVSVDSFLKIISVCSSLLQVPLNPSALSASAQPANRHHTLSLDTSASALGTRPEAKCYICWNASMLCVFISRYKKKKRKIDKYS